MSKQIEDEVNAMLESVRKGVIAVCLERDEKAEAYRACKSELEHARSKLREYQHALDTLGKGKS